MNVPRVMNVLNVNMGDVPNPVEFRVKRRRVKSLALHACLHCKVAHRGCSNERPCKRCVKMNLQCVDKAPEDSLRPRLQHPSSTTSSAYITIVLPPKPSNRVPRKKKYCRLIDNLLNDQAPTTTSTTSMFPRYNSMDNRANTITMDNDGMDPFMDAVLSSKVQRMAENLNTMVGTDDWASPRSLWDITEMQLRGCNEGYIFHPFSNINLSSDSLCCWGTV